MEIGDAIMDGQKTGTDMLLQESEDRRKAVEQKLAEVEGQLQQALAQREAEHNAARLSIAIANLRAGHLRKFLEPKNLAQEWYKAYRTHYVERGMPTKLWEDLSQPERAEIIAIATEVTSVNDKMQAMQDKKVDETLQDLMQEGDELSSAIHRLIILTEGGRTIWDTVVSVVRAMSAAGVDILPRGTIVHGVSTSPHRPE